MPCSRRSLRLRFVSDAVEQAYLRASARQSGWRAFWAVAAALALSSAALAVGFHQLFAAAGAPVLPLPVVLAAVEAALAVALGALGARRACVTRARGACGGTHWLWGAVPLLLGCSIVVAEDIWAPGPGYLHAQLWLLPLAAFFGGGLGWAVRFEHAAPGAWIPLLLYLGKTAGACERGDCYVPGMLDARHDGTPQLPMVAYFATLLVFAASATAAAWRAERSHRDAYVACRQTQLERSEIKMEDGRVRQLLGQALPYPLVCNLKDIAGARGTVDQQPQLTSLHHLPSVSILVVDVVAADACMNLSAAEVARIWNAVFAVIDGAVESVGCEKLGTVGWRYLAAAGLYASNTGETLSHFYFLHMSAGDSWVLCAEHAELAADCAASVRLAINGFCERHGRAQVSGSRQGIHSGEAVFGALGAGPAPARFDVFGETVSIAVRMAESADANSIVVSSATHGRLRSSFLTERKGVANLKRSQDGVEVFYLKGRQLGNRSPYRSMSTSPRVDSQRRHFALESMDLTSQVLAGCAFPGPVDGVDLSCLLPSAGESDSLEAEGLPESSSRNIDELSSWEHGLAPFTRQVRCGWSFSQGGWEEDYRVNEVISRRKNQARTLSILLVMFSVGLWMLEQVLAADESEPPTSQSGLPAGAVVDGAVLVWAQHVLLCLPIVLLLGCVFSKPYRRWPNSLTAMSSLSSAAAFAAVTVLNEGQEGLRRAEAVAMIWLTSVTYAYFGGSMQPAAAVLAGFTHTSLLVVALQFCVAPDSSWWSCGHIWPSAFLSVAVHANGIVTTVLFDRSRRLRYAWWSYYAAIAPAANFSGDVCTAGADSRGQLPKSEQLLRLLVPAHVATRALAEGSAAIDDFGSAMVAAVDVAGFSEIVRHAGGAADTGSVVAMSFVRDAFGIAAVLAQKYQVRLLRRSGTSLLVAAGTLGRGQSDAPLPAEAIADAERLALFGLELIENVRVWGVERWGAELSAKLGAGVRVGISTGRASCGLVGALRFGYDVWSSAVALANRLESHAALNTCCTTSEVRTALKTAGPAYRFDDRRSRPMLVQGQGSLRTFSLVEYVPAAAEAGRLSLSVATPSGVEFGLVTPVPEEEQEEPAVELLEPTPPPAALFPTPPVAALTPMPPPPELASARAALVPMPPPVSLTMPLSGPALPMPPTDPAPPGGRRGPTWGGAEAAEEVRAQTRPQRRIMTVPE